MSHMSDVTDRIGAASSPFASVLIRLLGRRSAQVQPVPAATLPTGPDPAALVDADMARLAAHASWAALRDDLRAQAAAQRALG